MEQAVIVHLPLRNEATDFATRREELLALERRLEETVVEAFVGELDGDEFGQGECVLYLYGGDADRLFGAIEPLLKSCRAATGGYAIKRYGDVTDANALMARVTW